MCDPVTASVIVAATAVTVGTATSYQQSYQASKHAKTVAQAQSRGAVEMARASEQRRQQGILQQQQNQAQIAQKLKSKRANMLARYNVLQGQTKQSGNLLGLNQLSDATTQTLG